MHVILSEERKIESRCQLEKLAIALIETQSEELETTQERRPVNDQWRAGRRFRNGLDPKLLSETKKRLDSRDVDWERERKKRGEKGVEREDAKNYTKRSKESSVKHETSPVRAYSIKCYPSSRV